MLALGYKAADQFRWHTDMAGDEGWARTLRDEKQGEMARHGTLSRLWASTERNRATLSSCAVSLPIVQVCSFSLGATATFEYLPTVAPSAKLRAEARQAMDPVRVPLTCGDCLLFHGGAPPLVASVRE